MRKILTVVLVELLVVSIFIGIVPVVAADQKTIYVPDDHSTIKMAVFFANEGDTIIIRDGTYKENVEVKKALTIRSENGAASTTISATRSDDHVFYVTSDYVNISGLTVGGATGDDKAGIFLKDNVDHCTISENTVSDNYYGICLSGSAGNTITDNIVENQEGDGIYLQYSSNNNIINKNTLISNTCGIRITRSSNYNQVIENNIVSSLWNGIYVRDSSNYNTIANNTIASSGYHGIEVSDSTSFNNIIKNTAENNEYYGIMVAT